MSSKKLSRRQAIKGSSAFLLPGLIGDRSLASSGNERVYPPARTITHGPSHHWFGYYDKLEFDPSNRFVLSNQVSFEHRTPRPADGIRVGMIDTEDNDRWIHLGESRAWGWQQGCMLQWRPNSKSEVVWNDREGDQHVCRVMDVSTKKVRTLPRPIYSLSQDGRWAITTDFSRIQRMRAGYGYVGLTDPAALERAPEDSGVWRMNMDTGESKLVFSLADAARIKHKGNGLTNHWNYFNHLLISPDSSRFIVLHRWKKDNGDANNPQPTGGFRTRMFTVAMDGSTRCNLDPSGNTSHFIWKDSEFICAWTRPKNKSAGFYLMRDQTKDISLVGAGVMTQNGHNTYVPNTKQSWILNDTYPSREKREQVPYLFHVPSGRRVDLGAFHSPAEYQGEWRCDTHPRCSNDGKTVAIDSPHAGGGRQIHLIDISKIIVEQ